MNLTRRNLKPDQLSYIRGRLYNRRKKAAHDGGKGKTRSESQSDTHLGGGCDGGSHMWEVLSKTKRKCRGCGLVATSEPTDTASAIAAEQGVSRATVIRDGKRAEELDSAGG